MGAPMKVTVELPVTGAAVGEVVIRVDAATARDVAKAWAKANAQRGAHPAGQGRWHDDVVHLLHAAFQADPDSTPIDVVLADGQRPFVSATGLDDWDLGADEPAVVNVPLTVVRGVDR